MSNSFELIYHHEAWIECDFVAACMLSKFISGQRAGLRRRKARVQIAASTLSGNSLRQTVHTHRASVHQAAKLVAALLRVAVVTAGLAESNGSLPPGLWLTSPAGWLPRTGISSGTLRSVIEYVLPLLFKVMPFVTYVGTLAAPSGPQPSARRIWIVSTQRTIEVNETSLVGRLSEQEEIYRLWPHAASPVPSDRSADNETVDEIRSMQYNTDECGSRKAAKISGRVWCCIL